MLDIENLSVLIRLKHTWTPLQFTLNILELCVPWTLELMWAQVKENKLSCWTIGITTAQCMQCFEQDVVDRFYII